MIDLATPHCATRAADTVAPPASVVIPAFNALPRLLEVLAEVCAQAASVGAEVILVDDASTDATDCAVREAFGDRVQRLRLSTNAGRSEARNRGAGQARSDVLLMLDADCIPAEGWLVAHLAALAAGAQVSIGAVGATGPGFWALYQRRVACQRGRRVARDPVFAFSSQNFAASKASFAQCGGFDRAYDKYGFEDRDLLARLIEHGAAVVATPGARVIHTAELRTADVAGKMYEAGRHTAGLFAARHARLYADSPYAAFDASLHPALATVAPLARPLSAMLVRIFARAIDASALPFALAAMLVRAISGLSFVAGSLDRHRMQQ